MSLQNAQFAADYIGNRMADIADVLPKHYRLTVVARYVGDEPLDADIILTDDELSPVIEAVRSLAARTDPNAPPGELNLATRPPIAFDGRDDLSAWFGLSYASFLTLPRVFMEAMPDAWQGRMAALLNEYQSAFPNQPDLGTRVQVTDGDGRLVKAPRWLLNYRHPDRDAIDACRAEPAP